VAGHETTATALAWAVERLVRHPEKLGRLAAEVAAGEDAYLKAVILETLRLRPVISIVNRTLKEPFEVGGYTLPAGVKVAPCIYLVHRRPDVYPEPERFLPERFLERPPGTYTWIPFGGGVRRCLGGAFAQFEMEVVLRELVSRPLVKVCGLSTPETLEAALSGDGPVIAIRAPGAGEPRVTFTLPRLLSTGALYLHIEGDEKAQVLDKALETGPVSTMPVRAVLSQSIIPVQLYWCP
jgi:hypothetical protein